MRLRTKRSIGYPSREDWETAGVREGRFPDRPAQSAVAGELERLGAVRDGLVRRDWPRSDETWRDSVYYSVLRSEWSAKAPDTASGGPDRFGRGLDSR
jgi:hypothetical protein